jgi:hypothetical protein
VRIDESKITKKSLANEADRKLMKWGYAKGSAKDEIHARELTDDLVEEMLSNHD